MKNLVLNGAWYGREMRPSGALIAGASVYRPSQNVITPAQDRAVAIAIAPDSDIDFVDVWAEANDTGLPFARVSARRPWWGVIPADSILVVPGRTFDRLTPTHYPIERYGANQEPRCAVTIFTERDRLPPWMPEQRAPTVRNWKTSSIAGALTLYACTAGRRYLSIASEISGFTAPAASATIAIDGIDTWCENGTTSWIYTALASNAALVAGDAPTYSYEGAAFDFIRITITPDNLAGVCTADVALSAED